MCTRFDFRCPPKPLNRLHPTNTVVVASDWLARVRDSGGNQTQQGEPMTILTPKVSATGPLLPGLRLIGTQRPAIFPRLGRRVDVSQVYLKRVVIGTL